MVYRKDWGQPMQGLQGFARTMKAFGRKINLSAADLAVTGNSIGAFIVPGGFMILGWYGNAVPAFGAGLTFSIGDPGNTARYLSASNIGAAGGAFPAILPGGAFFRTFTDTEIQILVANGVAASPGVLEFYMYGMTV